MANLEGDIKEKIEKLINKSMDVYSVDNIGKTIDVLNEAWGILPAPKEKWQEGFLIVKYILHSFFNANDFNSAEKWINHFLSYNKIRNYGESEFIAAKIKLELGKEIEAIDFFKIADVKSEGRVWEGEKNDKYIKFFNSKKI